jgi:hypothetical protein
MIKKIGYLYKEFYNGYKDYNPDDNPLNRYKLSTIIDSEKFIKFTAIFGIIAVVAYVVT